MPGRSVSLDNIHFASTASDVRAKCQEKIRLIAAWARQHPDARLVLQGYLEAGEADPRNNGLAERRTRAVRSALMAAGVDQSRIQILREAGTLPACEGRSEDCRELNRRVEISAIEPARSEITLAAVNPERLARSASAP
jgi:outer membrane protein OmpA-like peptidoglycan-associated protein